MPPFHVCLPGLIHMGVGHNKFIEDFLTEEMLYMVNMNPHEWSMTVFNVSKASHYPHYNKNLSFLMAFHVCISLPDICSPEVFLFGLQWDVDAQCGYASVQAIHPGVSVLVKTQTCLVCQIPGREVILQIVVGILTETYTLLSLYGWKSCKPHNSDPMTCIQNRGKEHLYLNSPADQYSLRHLKSSFPFFLALFYENINPYLLYPNHKNTKQCLNMDEK